MKLLVSTGPDAGRVISIDHEVVVGRAGGSADVTIDDPQISGRHLRVRPSGDGIEVEDLGSTNGTTVGGSPLTGTRVVASGERIVIGDTELLFQSESAATTAAAGGGTVVQPAAAGTVIRTAGTVVGGTAPRRITIAAVSGPGAPASAELVGDGALVIGRTQGQLVLGGDGQASGRHAEVRQSGETVEIADLGSSNGTFVDGARIASPTRISDASEIRVGSTTLRTTGAGAGAAAARGGSRVPAATAAGGGSGNRTPLLVGIGVAAVAVLGIGGYLLTSGGGGKKEVADTVASTAAATTAPATSAAAPASTAASTADTSAASTADTAASTADTSAASTADTGASTGAPSDTPLNAEQIIDLAKKSTVYILANRTDGNLASGSGTVVDKAAGLIITNNHVAGAAEKLQVRTDDMKRPVPAKLIAALPCDDLALIQIEDVADRAQFEQVALGDSTTLKAGETVFTVGFPGAADNVTDFTSANISIANGIVSKSETVFDIPGSDVVPLQSVIQHTAATNPGNSGGPLFNEFGQQVGVNTAGGGGKELQDYSITMARVLSLLDRMKSGYSSKWIGASLEVAFDSQQQPLGLTVGGLAPFGPADKANLVPGQLIAYINRRRTTTLKDYCENMPDRPNTKVRVTMFDPQSNKLFNVVLRSGLKPAA